MISRTRILCTAPAIALAIGCAKGASSDDPPGGPDAAADAPSCGDACDEDGDGVPDQLDQCPGTRSGDVVNMVGCAESQLTPTLEPEFPPFGLEWTPTGELGRAGGLTWTYTGIDRGDLFRIYWVLCDDPALTCGLSLDGPIEPPAEAWQYAPMASDLPAGRLVFTSTTRIVLDDGSAPTVTGRLTVTIVDGERQVIPFAALVTLGFTGRAAMFGAEIPGTGFEVVALGEVQDPSTMAWVPYLDYYDAAPTPAGGESPVHTSFGGWFYSK